MKFPNYSNHSNGTTPTAIGALHSNGGIFPIYYPRRWSGVAAQRQIGDGVGVNFRKQKQNI